MYLKNDITGQIAEFGNLQDGWSIATQLEIDAYLLAEAKINKIAELKGELDCFCDCGYIYEGNNFKTTNETILNIYDKDRLSEGAPNRYKFYDQNKNIVDFVDLAGWDNFVEAILQEKDRIMFSKYNPYYVQINACSTVAEVDAITIDFSA